MSFAFFVWVVSLHCIFAQKEYVPSWLGTYVPLSQLPEDELDKLGDQFGVCQSSSTCCCAIGPAVVTSASLGKKINIAAMVTLCSLCDCSNLSVALLCTAVTLAASKCLNQCVCSG